MKNQLKLPRFRLPFIFCLAITFAFTGCKQEECEDVVCENGACIEGLCECEAGYEGEECQTQSRARLLGTWEVGDICRGTAFVYEAVIAEGGSANAITIENLNDQTFPVGGSVSGLSVVLPEQTYGLGILSGAGGIDTIARVISLEYRIQEDGLPDEVCQATFRLP